MTFLNGRFRKFQVLQAFFGKYENDQASRKISGGEKSAEYWICARENLQLMRESLTDFLFSEISGLIRKHIPQPWKIKAWKSKKKRYFCVNAFSFSMWAFLQLPAVSFPGLFLFFFCSGPIFCPQIWYNKVYHWQVQVHSASRDSNCGDVLMDTLGLRGYLGQTCFFFGRRPLLQNHLMEQT